jgi:hypothetical protein
MLTNYLYIVQVVRIAPVVKNDIKSFKCILIPGLIVFRFENSFGYDGAWQVSDFSISLWKKPPRPGRPRRPSPCGRARPYPVKNVSAVCRFSGLLHARSFYGRIRSRSSAVLMQIDQGEGAKGRGKNLSRSPLQIENIRTGPVISAPLLAYRS